MMSKMLDYYKQQQKSHGSLSMKVRKKMLAAHRGVPLNRTAFAIVIGVLCFAASRLTSNEKKVSTLQTGGNQSNSSMELCAVRFV